MLDVQCHLKNDIILEKTHATNIDSWRHGRHDINVNNAVSSHVWNETTQ